MPTVESHAKNASPGTLHEKYPCKTALALSQALREEDLAWNSAHLGILQELQEYINPCRKPRLGW